MSVKMSFGSEPPRFGSTAGLRPVVRRIESIAHCTHGSSGSMRVAWNISSRVGAIFTIGKPCRSRWRRSAGRISRGSMPTTKRSWQRAQARGGMAFTGVSGLPVL